MKNDNVLQIFDMRDVFWFKLEILILNVMNEKKKKLNREVKCLYKVVCLFYCNWLKV